MKNKGIHILADLHDCNFDKLNGLSKKRLRGLFSAMVKDNGLTEVGKLFYFFNKISFTMVIALSESHVSLHTWPEDNYVSLDIFVCNYSKNNTPAAKNLYKNIISLFSPKKIKQKIIKR